MGINAYLLQVRPKKLEKILEDPEILEEIVFPDGEESKHLFYLDKASTGIHFLLTGFSDMEQGNIPEKYIVGGDKELETEMDFGDGFAKYITEKQVQEADDFLQQINIEALKNQFTDDYFSFLEFYEKKELNGSTKENEVKYILFYFEKVKNYYKKATLKKNAMLYFFD